jgi:hypothetical protein
MTQMTQLAETVLGPSASSLLESCAQRSLVSGGPAIHRPGLPLPLSGLTRSEIEQLVRARRSVRAFAARPVELTTAVKVVQAGVDAADSFLAQGSDIGSSRWVVLARDVTPLASGAYVYVGSELSWLAALPDDEAMAYAGQPTLTTAPVVLLPLWNLADAVSRQGTDGYVNTLVTAGAALYSAWLVSVSLGLAGCLFRGINPALLHRRLGVGRPTGYPVLALALGYAYPPAGVA